MPPKRNPADRKALAEWWATLSAPGFVALPPPGTGRQRAAEARDEAAGLSFACWLAPDTGVFTRAGALTGPLPLHWGGDHAVVKAALGTGPSGYAITDGGPDSPFLFDRETTRDTAGMPFPDDPVGVRQFLAGLSTPLAGAEAAWLHDRLRDLTDLDAVAAFVGPLDDRGELTRDELDRLLTAWRAGGRTVYWRGWRALVRALVRALLRAEHPEAWAVVDELKAHVSTVLAEVPSKRGLELVRAAVTGRRDVHAVGPWLRIRRALHEPDVVDAAAAIVVEMPERVVPELVRAIREELAGADVEAGRLAVRRLAVDERLPRPVRVEAAFLTREWRARAMRGAVALPERRSGKRECAQGPPGLRPTFDRSAGAGVRWRTRVPFPVDNPPVVDNAGLGGDAEAELLSGTGPDLSLADSYLGKIWHYYRVLAPGDVAWLKARVADPATPLRGVAYCLELLYAHGEATAADVDALASRWKPVLAKKYVTTYTEWRHPMVTLTCLARDLGHPLAAALEKWWAAPAPKWKDALRPLTWLGAPDEDAAARLWTRVTSSAHDSGHLMTWVLMRVRLDGVPPRWVAAELAGRPGMREHLVKRVLVGTADPAQPLWHYDTDPRSWSWWHRAVEIAEDASLPEPARALARKVAGDHYLLHYPGQVTPPPSQEEIVAASRWVSG